ncbi:restriction endonuclease [Salirhabdus sp. Marseille-P4669]|uniref:restriction endonuclease n=1 Tax=Salirhabdus sp. Marseille-P4669 TaxID=2042310 RepID=UPI001F259745|nr:restriction endonuclease [Salirhabdus sp. Marseille-P4669]
MSKPTRKQRKQTVYIAVTGPIIFIGLWIMFQFHFTNLYYIIGLIFFAVIIGEIGSSFVPDMRKKENKHKNMYTGLPAKNAPAGKNESQSVRKTKTQSNLLRTKKEILTLPLEDLSWREFEELCFLYYKAKGFKPEKTSEGADGGVDLIIYNPKDNLKIAVQIKKYQIKNQINVNLIRELDSAKKNKGCIAAEFITTSRFTNDALVEADSRRIVCRDIEWVHSELLQWRETQ